MPDLIDEPHIRLYMLPDGISCKVYGWDVLSELGLTQVSTDAAPEPHAPSTAAEIQLAKERIHEGFHRRGEWREIWLNEANGLRRRQIQEKCRIRDEEKGFIFDDTRRQAARLAVMVSRWNGFPNAPSMDAYDGMREPLIDAIDRYIIGAMYPSSESDPDFFALWKNRPKASEERSPSCSTGETSTAESSSGSI